MKLTPFGHVARTFRMKYDLSMKQMADALGISSSHMSGIEYGEKTLADKHVEGAVQFFKTARATEAELRELREAAASSKDSINVAHLQPEARTLVAAFARRLQDGAQPTNDLKKWIDSKFKP